MNSRVKILTKKLFDKYFWRQHPEAALRYWPVVREIKKAKLENSKILEIGPGSLGIVPYLKGEIVGIDVDFSGPQTKSLNKIKGKATELPFRKNSYDATISVDVLEHIPPQLRETAILEMLRVTKRLAIIVIPTGEHSEEQDRQLHERWNKVFKTKNQFLEEHVKFGLPKNEEIFVYIDRSLRKLKKDAKTRSYPNLNIFIRKILMLTWITKNKYLYYLYLKGFLLFMPILKFANFEKTYRRVFVVEFTQAS